MIKRAVWRSTLAILLLAIFTIPALTGYVAAATRDYRYTDLRKVPAARVAIVFGAGLRRDGAPSSMLADRVGAAVQLYQAGMIEKILMTGDNSRADYDEVTAMERYAVERGVPARDITLDYAGFSTYESCYRARIVFGVTAAVLVTQDYHLPRAVYTCRQLSIDASGLGTPDWDEYPDRVMWPYQLRETLATLKALWDLHVTRPAPTFLGPYEGIDE
jgi:vancomycin permeability regulator SanA